MPSYKILCVASCLVAVSITCSAAPGHHASSYAVSNLHHHGGHGGGGFGGGSDGGWGGHDDHHHHHPKYNFKYGVEDHHTGDHKEQKEERDGDVVHGEYSLLQPDGRKRIVHYTSSHHGGFNAHVTYSGHAIHPYHHHH